MTKNSDQVNKFTIAFYFSLKLLSTFSALTLNAVKLVLKEMAAFHATGQHFIATYPGGLDVLSQECRRVKQSYVVALFTKQISNDYYNFEPRHETCFLTIEITDWHYF